MSGTEDEAFNWCYTIPMKLKHKSDRNLESLKVFPYIAWGVTIFFAIFVYNIALELQETADQLATQAAYLEAQTKLPVNQIELPN